MILKHRFSVWGAEGLWTLKIISKICVTIFLGDQESLKMFNKKTKNH